jgi:hypothetical protein
MGFRRALQEITVVQSGVLDQGIPEPASNERDVVVFTVRDGCVLEVAPLQLTVHIDRGGMRCRIDCAIHEQAVADKSVLEIAPCQVDFLDDSVLEHARNKIIVIKIVNRFGFPDNFKAY